jgi:uncharacterized surface protein with fasciclin (FAS1) repeats
VLNENDWQTLQHVLTGGSLSSLPGGQSDTRGSLVNDRDQPKSASSDVGDAPIAIKQDPQKPLTDLPEFNSGAGFQVFPIQVFPGRGPSKAIDLRKYTIAEILNWTLHHPSQTHALPLHKLAHLVNHSSSVNDLLNDSSASLTFFAPDDNALTPPWKRGKPHTECRDGTSEWDQAAAVFDNADVAMHPLWEAVDHVLAVARPESNMVGDGDDEKMKKRKRVLLHILEVVLKYHVSPGAKTIGEITDASTLPMVLPISRSEDAPAFRVRVGEPSLVLNAVSLNLLSRLLHHPPIRAKNGIIYLIGRLPLIPPLSPLSNLFLFPEPFATLTTAAQKVGLDKGLLPHFGNRTFPIVGAQGEDDEVDERVAAMLNTIVDVKDSTFHKSSFTIFAPTNKAFRELGPRLNAFLFSPFGSRLLRHLLSYHVVPDLIFHTDHIDNLTSSADQYITGRHVGVPLPEALVDYDSVDFVKRQNEERDWDKPSSPSLDHPKRPPPAHPIPPSQVTVTHYLLPTLLGSRANESLAVDVVQYRLRLGHGPLVRRIVIHPSFQVPPETQTLPPQKPVAAILADGVAWGGAIHVIPKLIRPPFLHDRHDESSFSRIADELWA